MRIFDKLKKYDKNGFDKYRINKKTGTKYDEYGFDWKGFDKGGFDKGGIHKKTGTKYDENGFDRNWRHRVTGTLFDEYGFDKDGIQGGIRYEQGGFDWTSKIESHGLDGRIGNISFQMIPFQGENRFAKLISSGTVDFYDSDSPAYILNVKLPHNCNQQVIDKLITAIRHSHTFKPSIFPSQKSVGAYWVTDQIDIDTAKIILKKIMENFFNGMRDL